MKFPKFITALTIAALMAATACSTTSAYMYPKAVQQRYTITTGDVDRPYESLGYVQLTKKGFDLFAFISVVPANLEALFGQELIPVLQRAGADGIINVRFHERQWTPAERIGFLFSVVGIFWLPTQVELTGELIRYK